MGASVGFFQKGVSMDRQVFCSRYGLKIGLWLCFFTVFGLMQPSPNAWASCGSGNCFLVTGAQDGIATPGQVTLDISYRYIPMDDFQRGSSSTPEVLTPKIDFENRVIENPHHREVRTINELMQVDVVYGVTERFTLQLALPLVNDRMHEHYDGVTTPSTAGTFTREDGSSGIGDIRLTGKYAPVVSTRHLFVLGGGVKFPTGEYKLLDAEGTINEPTVQPGTGAYDFLFSFFYDYQIRPHKLDAFFSGNYQLATENDLNYEFGDQTFLNLGLNYLLESERKITLSGQLNYRHAERDHFDTTSGTQGVPSTGGDWLNLTPGIRVQASDQLSLYSFVQLPLYQYVNEVNLVPRYGLVLGATYSF